MGERGFGAERQIVFNNIDRPTLAPFISARRLGSPQHYRYYFAFALPGGALSDATVEAFISTAQNAPADAIPQIAALARQQRPQGGTMAEVLIDRLTAAANRIPQSALTGILAALDHVMDDIARSSPDGDFVGHSRAWLGGQRAVTLLLRQAEAETRGACLRALFTDGISLGWLTSIFRSETFAHGHYGEQRQPEDQWLLTANEFAAVLSTMLERYRSTPPAVLLAVPNFGSLLYAWKQGSRDDEAKAWVENQTRTDAGLLAFLSRVRSWRATNGEVFHPLKQEDLEHFMDYAATAQRVQHLAENPVLAEGDRQLAAELLQALDQGRRGNR